MKKCLVIVHLRFYGFADSIKKDLEGRGYEVDMMNVEYPIGLLWLVVANFFGALSRRLTLSRFARFFEETPTHYDLVLMINARGASVALVDLLKKHADRIVGYSWDSFDHTSNPLLWFKSVESYKTFDFVDSAKYGLKRVDLFTESVPPGIPSKKVDISCVMKNHSDRLVYLDNIYQQLSKKYSFRIYIYEQDVLTLARNVLRHPLLVYKWRKYIHFNWLRGQEYYAIIGESRCTIDFSHPRQTGITMRCFQAAAYGTKIITNNEHIAHCDVFDSRQYIVYRIDDGAASLPEILETKLLGDPVSSIRTLSDYLDDIMR